MNLILLKIIKMKFIISILLIYILNISNSLLQEPTTKRNSSPDNSGISILLENDKSFCTSKYDKITFKISISNKSILPKFKKFACFSLYDWYKYNVVLNVVHNEEKYMSSNIIDKCASTYWKILIKGIPVKFIETVQFKYLTRQNNRDFLTRKDNTDYGSYTIQAFYILKKDTLSSNIITVDYNKD